MPKDNSDWLLFLSLERDVIATFDYVPVDHDKERHHNLSIFNRLSENPPRGLFLY